VSVFIFETEMLQLAIRNLYVTFSECPRKDTIEACPCCVTEHDQRMLFSQPLSRLSANNLRRYAQKAISSWGDPEDLKHFLPRLLELVALEPGWQHQSVADAPTLFRKFRRAGWHEWPTGQRGAVELYLMAWWRCTLARYPEQPSPEVLLSCAAQIIEDLTPFLEFWRAKRAIPAMKQLAEFVERLATGLQQNGTMQGPWWNQLHMQRSQIRDWLLDFRTINALENAYFSFHPDPGAEAFGRAAELLCRLKESDRSQRLPLHRRLPDHPGSMPHLAEDVSASSISESVH